MVNDSLINTNYLYKSQVVELTIDASGSAFKKPLRLTEVFSETFGNDYPTDDLVFSKLAYPIETFLRTTNQIKDDEDRFLIEDFINTYIKDLNWNVSPYSRKPYDFVSFKYDHASGSGVELSTADNSVKILMTYKIKEVWNSSTRDGEIVEKKPIDKKMFSRSKISTTTEAADFVSNVYFEKENAIGGSEDLGVAIKNVISKLGGIKMYLMNAFYDETNNVNKEAIGILGGVGEKISERVMGLYGDTLNGEDGINKDMEMLAKFAKFLEALDPMLEVKDYFQSHFEISTEKLYDENFSKYVVLKTIETVAGMSDDDLGKVSKDSKFIEEIRGIVSRTIEETTNGVREGDIKTIQNKITSEVRNATRRDKTWSNIAQVAKELTTGNNRTIHDVLEKSLYLTHGTRIGYSRLKNFYADNTSPVKNIISLMTLLYTQELPIGSLVEEMYHAALFYGDPQKVEKLRGTRKNVVLPKSIPSLVAAIPEITHIILITLYLLENLIWFDSMASRGFVDLLVKELETSAFDKPQTTDDAESTGGDAVKKTDDSMRKLMEVIGKKLQNATRKVTSNNYIGGTLYTASEKTATLCIELYLNDVVIPLSHLYYIPYSMRTYVSVAKNLLRDVRASDPAIAGSSRADSEKWNLLLHSLDTQYGTLKQAELNNKTRKIFVGKDDKTVFQNIIKALGGIYNEKGQLTQTHQDMVLAAKLFSQKSIEEAKKMLNNIFVVTAGFQLSQKATGASGTLNINDNAEYSVIVSVPRELRVLFKALNGHDEETNKRAGGKENLQKLLYDFIKGFVVNASATQSKDVVSLGDIVLYGQMGLLQRIASSIEETLVKAAEVTKDEARKVITISGTQPNFLCLGSCENMPLKYVDLLQGQKVKILKEETLDRYFSDEATSGTGHDSRVFVKDTETNSYIYNPSPISEIEKTFKRKFANTCVNGLGDGKSNYVFVVSLLQRGVEKGFDDPTLDWKQNFYIKISLRFNNDSDVIDTQGRPTPGEGTIKIPLSDNLVHAINSMVMEGRNEAWVQVKGLYDAIETVRKTYTIETVSKMVATNKQTLSSQQALTNESNMAGDKSFAPKVAALHSGKSWEYVANVLVKDAVPQRKGSKKAKTIVEAQ